MSVENLIIGGPSGILLAVLCIITGILTMLVERLLGGSGKASLQVQLLQVPQQPLLLRLLLLIQPIQLRLLQTQTAQLAAAVVITALVAPAFTGWLDKKLAKKNDNIPTVDNGIKFFIFLFDNLNEFC